MRHRLGLLLLLAALSLPLAGCSFNSDIDNGEDVSNEQPSQYDNEGDLAAERDEAAGEDQANRDEAEYLASSGWQCRWDPTMNNDWHDDYLCSNGVSTDRPYLLPGDSFVERWELDNAAADYAASLNG